MKIGVDVIGVEEFAIMTLMVFVVSARKNYIKLMNVQC